MFDWVGRWALGLNLLGFLLNAGIYLRFGIVSSLYMALLNAAVILALLTTSK